MSDQIIGPTAVDKLKSFRLDREDRLVSALRIIANLTPEMIDVLPLDQAFTTIRYMTKIARDALKE